MLSRWYETVRKYTRGRERKRSISDIWRAECSKTTPREEIGFPRRLWGVGYEKRKVKQISLPTFHRWRIKVSLEAKRFVKGKKEYEPLSPQPSNVITVSRYYTVLKRCPTYQRRITWIDSDKEAVALVEYIGSYPKEGAAHGNASITLMTNM